MELYPGTSFLLERQKCKNTDVMCVHIKCLTLSYITKVFLKNTLSYITKVFLKMYFLHTSQSGLLMALPYFLVLSSPSTHSHLEFWLNEADLTRSQSDVLEVNIARSIQGVFWYFGL